MAVRLRTRTFKSGNSVALRLPKGLGLKEGDEMQIVSHANGRFSMWRADDDAAMLDSLYGSMSQGFMRDGRGEIEQGERAWDSDALRSAA